MLSTDDIEMMRHLKFYREVKARLTPVPAQLNQALLRSRRVLDMRCGNGLWLVDQARTHTWARFDGIDFNPEALHRAQNYAKLNQLFNVIFVNNDLHHLDADIFRRTRYDYIHLSSIVETLLNTSFADLVRNLYDHCNDGGCIEWLEFELPITNSKAFENFTLLINKALTIRGQRFELAGNQVESIVYTLPTFKRFAIETKRLFIGHLPMMARWLRDAGFEYVSLTAHSIDIGSGSAMNSIAFEQFTMLTPKIKPFLTELTGVISPSNFDELTNQIRADIQDPKFCGMLLGLTAHGWKGKHHG